MDFAIALEHLSRILPLTLYARRDGVSILYAAGRVAAWREDGDILARAWLGPYAAGKLGAHPVIVSTRVDVPLDTIVGTLLSSLPMVPERLVYPVPPHLQNEAMLVDALLSPETPPDVAASIIRTILRIADDAGGLRVPGERLVVPVRVVEEGGMIRVAVEPPGPPTDPPVWAGRLFPISVDIPTTRRRGVV